MPSIGRLEPFQPKIRRLRTKGKLRADARAFRAWDKRTEIAHRCSTVGKLVSDPVFERRQWRSAPSCSPPLAPAGVRFSDLHRAISIRPDRPAPWRVRESASETAMECSAKSPRAVADQRHLVTCTDTPVSQMAPHRLGHFRATDCRIRWLRQTRTGLETRCNSSSPLAGLVIPLRRRAKDRRCPAVCLGLPPRVVPHPMETNCRRTTDMPVSHNPPRQLHFRKQREKGFMRALFRGRAANLDGMVETFGGMGSESGASCATGAPQHNEREPNNGRFSACRGKGLSLPECDSDFGRLWLVASIPQLKNSPHGTMAAVRRQSAICTSDAGRAGAHCGGRQAGLDD
jgi:hypothetical protein